MAEYTDYEDPMDEAEEVPEIVLTLDDDTELICQVLSIFPYQGKEYIALLSEDEEEECYLYEYQEGEDPDDVVLKTIDSDEEFDAVVNILETMLDEDFSDEDELEEEEMDEDGLSEDMEETQSEEETE